MWGLRRLPNLNGSWRNLVDLSWKSVSTSNQCVRIEGKYSRSWLGPVEFSGRELKSFSAIKQGVRELRKTPKPEWVLYKWSGTELKISRCKQGEDWDQDLAWMGPVEIKWTWIVQRLRWSRAAMLTLEEHFWVSTKTGCSMNVWPPPSLSLKFKLLDVNYQNSGSQVISIVVAVALVMLFGVCSSVLAGAGRPHLLTMLRILVHNKWMWGGQGDGKVSLDDSCGHDGWESTRLSCASHALLEISKWHQLHLRRIPTQQQSVTDRQEV